MAAALAAHRIRAVARGAMHSRNAGRRKLELVFGKKKERLEGLSSPKMTNQYLLLFQVNTAES
jgi:hypothetical protein